MFGQTAARVRRFAFGRPSVECRGITERLSKLKALAVFSSDNLSSVGVRDRGDPVTLLAAGAGTLWTDSLPIAA